MEEMYELKQVKVRLCLAEAEPLYSTEQITTPDKAVEIMSQALAQMDREYCCVVNLDGANRPINFNVVSIGDTNQTHVPMQNIFKSAIIQNSSNLLALHNHPSGNVTPSREDVIMTKKLIKAGRLMNIKVMDHIIVGGGNAGLYSFRDKMPELFDVWGLAEAVHDPALRENDYKPFAKVEELKEQNYNMIDNVLNNLPNDRRNTRRERISMKAKLAEKKAEVMEKEKDPPEMVKTRKNPCRDVDD